MSPEQMACTENTPSFRALQLGDIQFDQISLGNFETQESVQGRSLRDLVHNDLTMTWEMMKADVCVQYDECTIPSDFNFRCRFQGGTVCSQWSGVK